MDLNDDDLEVEICLDDKPRTVEELIESITTAPIRATHKPSGISAVGEGQGNQVKNKARAIELLRETLLKQEPNDDAGRTNA